jgi:hypothetical protein
LFPDLPSLGAVRKMRKRRSYRRPAEPIKKQEQIAIKGIDC